MKGEEKYRQENVLHFQENITSLDFESKPLAEGRHN